MASTKVRAHVLALKHGKHEGRKMVERLAPTQTAQKRLAGQTPVGQTQHFVVSSDGSADGNTTAQAVLQHAEQDFATIQGWFGGLNLPPGQEGDDQTVVRTALPIQVGMDANAGGAYHYSCAGTDVYIQPTPNIGPALVVAEVVEVFEAAQGKGWDCGQTNGEGLSRVLAGDHYTGLASDFVATEQSWWNNGHSDYVNSNTATDQDESGNGCATLFLYYLKSQLGFTWEQIVAAGAGSLGATYQKLTNQDPQAGFNDFLGRLATIDNGVQLNLPASGNPFPISGTATPRQTGGGFPVGPVLIVVGIIAIIVIAYLLLHH